MKEEKDVEKQIIEFCNLVNQSTIVGIIISNGEVACALLGSMPNCFVSLIMSRSYWLIIKRRNEKKKWQK